jgi:hypothetical protein
MAKRAIFGRVGSVLAPTLLGLLAATACGNDFDATRNIPSRGTLGAEIFGVLCDRMGGQSLHEDLTGASYQAICHGENDNGVFGQASFSVNQSALPPITGTRPTVDGGTVSQSQQETDRSYGVARLERLAQDRARLIAALDATFPDIQVPVKNLGASDPTQSCNASGMGSLHDELSNLLGRLAPLYDDGTLPAATEGLGSVAQAFIGSQGAQTAWTRFNSRAGYRPIPAAIGVVRPALAYSNLRDFANATLGLVSPDSDPYDPKPTFKNGVRVPVPGAAYPQLSSLVAAAHAELKNVTADPPLNPVVLGQTADATFGSVLDRPMTDLETLQAVLFHTDPAFAKAPFSIGAAGSSSPPRYIVQRDPRGYASVPLVNGALPAPFTTGSDGLPAIDALGQFMTAGAATVATPFPVDDTDTATRDAFGRLLAGGQPVYGYLDTNQTYMSAFLAHLRGVVAGKSLVDSNQADNHETLMNFIAGAYALFGAQVPNATRSYADGSMVTYSGFQPVGAPIADLVYALGQIIADPSADATLSFLQTLTAQNPNDVARLIGDMLYDKSQSDQHPEAQIPAASTLWDEMNDLLTQIATDTSKVGTGQTRLLEDVLTAFAAPASLGLSKGLASQAGNLDVISYDRNNLNGPAVNVTNGGSLPKTPPDHTMPDANANRSELQRFAQLVHDTHGVTLCNKEGAVLHAVGTPLGNADACASTAGNNGELCPAGSNCACNNARVFHECEMLKVSDLASFYLDSVVGAAHLYFRNKLVREGAIVGTGNAPGSLGATSVSVTEQSSGIGLHLTGTAPDDTYNGPSNPDPAAPGFWDPLATVWNPTTTPPTYLRPKPAWIHRQIEFDLVKDSPTSSGKNYLTNNFLQGLQGLDVGTTACPERLIPDPCKTDAHCFDSAADNDVASDGMVHGLRSCQDGDWLYQRDPDTLFEWEENGFLTALAPLANAFVSHGREDLFIQLMEVLNKHWQTAAGAAASADECKLTPTTSCTKDGADTYEPILTAIFGSDLLTGLNNLANIAKGMNIPTCSAIDPVKHTCTTPGPTQTGIQVLAAATRSLVDPALAMTYGLKDSTGKTTAPRNDGTTNPQVTPMYLLVDALDEIDSVLGQNAMSTTDADKNRLAEWKLARSQLVDEVMTVNGENTTSQTFADTSLPLIAPVVVSTLRSVLLARCGATETTGKCSWARGFTPDPTCPPGMVKGTGGACAVPTAMWNEMVAATGGPTFSGAVEVLDAIRQNQNARTAIENLLAYMADPKQADSVGQVESLGELLTTGHDILQVLRDDPNLTPVYQALAPAFVPPTSHPDGKNVIDATTTLLSRLAGHAYDTNGKEICSKELDPNSVLDVALAHLVTPMPTGSGDAGGGSVGETPLEVVVDTIADVNRASPSDKTDPLKSADYENISNEVNEFLTDPERGLEQFYAVIRNATGSQQ